MQMLRVLWVCIRKPICSKRADFHAVKYVHIYTYTHKYTYIYNTHIHIHIHIHIHVYTYTRIYIHTYMHIYIYTYITYIHIYIYTYIHIYIYTYIYIYIYTDIQIYIYTYVTPRHPTSWLVDAWFRQGSGAHGACRRNVKLQVLRASRKTGEVSWASDNIRALIIRIRLRGIRYTIRKLK